MYTDAGPPTQHRILQALFERVEVLGPSEVRLHPTVEAEACGWAAAVAGEFRVEGRKAGLGERDSPATSDLPITMRLSEPPEACDLVRSA